MFEKNLSIPNKDMPMKRKGLLATVSLLPLILVLLASQVFAALGTDLSVSYLTQQADVVVKGELISVEELSDNRGIAKIRVNAVIKGQWAEDTAAINFSLNRDFPLESTDLLMPGENAIFFLKRKENILMPISWQHIKVPVRMGRPAVPDESKDSMELVRAELLFTASGPTTLSKEEEAKQKIAQEAARKHNLSDLLNLYPAVPMNAIAAEQLGSFPPEEHTTTLLKKLLISPERYVRGAAIAALLQLNQPEALAPAVEYIDTRKPNSILDTDRPRNRDPFLFNIVNAIGVVDSPQALPALSRLLEEDNVLVRLSAVRSLRRVSFNYFKFDKPLKNLSEGKTIPLLVRALDDKDAGVRREAMWALSEIARKPWFPPLPTDQKNFTPEDEARLLGQWKQWWQAEGKAAFENAAH